MINQRRLERLAVRILPRRAKETFGGLYNKARMIRANQEYQPADIDTGLGDNAPQHVVLVVVDALRYDYLGRETAPFLSAKEPDKAIAPSTWTFPSISSIVTGRYPHEHGAMRQSDELDEVDELLVPKLSTTETTLPEILGGAGFETMGSFGFDIPFLALRSRFHDHRLYQDPNAEQILGSHQKWIGDRQRQHTFSYLHLSDLHTPHHPPEQYATDFDVDRSIDDIETWRYTDETEFSPEVRRYQEHKRRLYRASLRYVDDMLESYYNALKETFGSDVLVVVTGDHGEGFWEHVAFDAAHFQDSRPAYCVGHGGTPYECVTRVPLWIDELDPRSTGLTSLVDVAPTILESLGLNEELETTGTPLTQASDESRVVLTEGTRYGYEKKAVYRNGWKIVKSLGDDTSVAFEIEAEPTETTIPSEVESEMLDGFPKWPDGRKGATNPVSGTVEQRLRDLGYQ